MQRPIGPTSDGENTSENRSSHRLMKVTVQDERSGSPKVVTIRLRIRRPALRSNALSLSGRPPYTESPRLLAHLNPDEMLGDVLEAVNE